MVSERCDRPNWGRESVPSGGDGQVDGQGWDGVKDPFVGKCEGRSVEEGCDCTESNGCGADSAACVVLDSSPNSNIG